MNNIVVGKNSDVTGRRENDFENRWSFENNFWFKFWEFFWIENFDLENIATKLFHLYSA